MPFNTASSMFLIPSLQPSDMTGIKMVPIWSPQNRDKNSEQTVPSPHVGMLGNDSIHSLEPLFLQLFVCVYNVIYVHHLLFTRHCAWI